MKEQDYQRKIVKCLEARGGYVVKVITASKKGVPDVLCCYKGYFVAIEVKTPSTMSNTSELQKYNLGLIQKADGYSMVAWDVQHVNTMLDRIDSDNS